MFEVLGNPYYVIVIWWLHRMQVKLVLNVVVESMSLLSKNWIGDAIVLE